MLLDDSTQVVTQETKLLLSCSCAILWLQGGLISSTWVDGGGRVVVVRKRRVMPLNSITLTQKQPIHFISKKSHVAPDSRGSDVENIIHGWRVGSQ